MGCWGCITTILLIYITYLLLAKAVGLNAVLSFFLAVFVVLFFFFIISKKHFVYYVNVGGGPRRDVRWDARRDPRRDVLDSQENQETLIPVDCSFCGQHICHALPGSQVQCQNCGKQVKAGR